MLLVAGGQLDQNIGRLLKRILERGVPYFDILLGPELIPRIVIDLDDEVLVVNGRALNPSSCFIRHDVFLQQAIKSAEAQAAALNWYYAVRGWALSQDKIRGFNRRSYMSENSKIQNLLCARKLGLKIPRTIVASRPFENIATLPDSCVWIQKPVAGGSYTTLLSDCHPRNKLDEFPRFIQHRLLRPEMRVYNIAGKLSAFRLESPDVDYRISHDVKISAVEVPDEIKLPLTALCNELGIDFSASDFMLDDTGDFNFLEINTQPMFAAFDRIVEGRLCDDIINHLADQQN
ncbi:hypothetical protein IB279_17615 [Ensifer sp. ENS06]|uniref:hypothetical protein n=1 Tax=Ensifer sp. ENS06 TaxID=2769276 RepID=UPI001784F528|nr:hypothetical protein [Ensifer sp. ENS06]MBD9624762.1 hypothetical protein [Ensifer sp. ENS06]